MADRKPAITYSEQLAKLRNRGLNIEDEAFALHSLEHLNYYRLSAYRFPLSEPGNPDQFLPGVTFKTLWDLYEFDRRLRHLVTEGLKHLEVSIRARWAYIMGHAHGSHAFENTRLFTQPQRYANCMARLDEELKRSDEVFVTHYRQRDGTRPPIWGACEVMSFGVLSRFVALTGPAALRKELARTYQLFPDTLKSFLEHAVYVRNLCAHHARLWNRRFTVTMTLPNAQPKHLLTSFNPAEDRRIYNTLVLLAHIVERVAPHDNWRTHLIQLIETAPWPVCPEMGFPDDWRTREGWASHEPLPSPSPTTPVPAVDSPPAKGCPPAS